MIFDGTDETVEIVRLGGHHTVPPAELRLPRNSFSTVGHFLQRVVVPFRTAVATAHVHVIALVAKDPTGPLRLIYEDGDGGTAELTFAVPAGPLTPACVPLPVREADQAAAIGLLDAETVGRALYPFAMQLREPIEVRVPEATIE